MDTAAAAAAAPSAALAAAWRSSAPFLGGGLAGCLATLCIQPADYLKTQLQLQALQLAPGARALGPGALLLRIARTDGLRVLYSGLSAAWARQFVYTSARVGLYATATAAAREAGGGGPLALAGKLACAAGAGGLAALVSTPLDLALTRIQAETGRPAGARAALGGPGAVLWGIYAKEGGLRAVWRGAAPTVLRAVLLNVRWVGGLACSWCCCGCSALAPPLSPHARSPPPPPLPALY
jgi:solute carrier family 25 oxoglutarate transporter 11